MAADTTNLIKLGPPRLLRMVHPFANTQMFIVAQDQPLPFHFWMVQRVGVTMQANSASSTLPPLFNLYHAPSGVVELSSGNLTGTSQVGTGPQGSDMVLLDSVVFGINGTATISPYVVADEDHPIYVPENRVLVGYLSGYSLSGAAGVVQVEIQYEDWILDIPKTSPLPQNTDNVGAENL